MKDIVTDGLKRHHIMIMIVVILCKKLPNHIQSQVSSVEYIRNEL